jgi:hypothetical protein
MRPPPRISIPASGRTRVQNQPRKGLTQDNFLLAYEDSQKPLFPSSNMISVKPLGVAGIDSTQGGFEWNGDTIYDPI